jgi:hypothetical protein
VVVLALWIPLSSELGGKLSVRLRFEHSARKVKILINREKKVKILINIFFISETVLKHINFKL